MRRGAREASKNGKMERVLEIIRELIGGIDRSLDLRLQIVTSDKSSRASSWTWMRENFNVAFNFVIVAKSRSRLSSSHAGELLSRIRI